MSVAIVLCAAGYYVLRLRSSSPNVVPPGTAAPAAETPSAARPTLWVLSIGVSRYKEAGITLQFADADARAVDAAFQEQRQGPIYSEVRSLLLTNEQVTRESIMNGIQRFLGQAGPDDLAAIFMAGHGVQDRTTGSYYFLPHPASAENLLTEGLRMSDFDEMMRILRRNIRRVVVMLDTCHAGALQLSARAVMAGDTLASGVQAGEGLFLLAAAKPGEESKEQPELGHGAFTYALLEGLRGAADTTGEGFVSVSDLFSYVARRVPRLTAGAQHPYHKIEGTDLTLAAVPRLRDNERAAVAAVAEVAQAELEPTAPPSANAIEVTDFRNLRNDPDNDWRGSMLRVALCTELSKIRALRVYSSEFVGRAGKPEAAEELRSARQRGIGKLLRGSFVMQGDVIRIDAGIWDSVTGVNQGSESVEGRVDDFFDLEKELVIRILRRMPVEVSPEEGDSIKEETNTSVNAYKLLLEAEGVAHDPAAATPGPTAPRTRGLSRGTKAPPGAAKDGQRRQGRAGSAAQRLGFDPRLLWGGVAYADEPAALPEAEVLATLEEYREALENKNLDKLAELYAAFSQRQRDALGAYLDHAGDLRVEIADVQVELRGNTVAVSFTRRDQFVDRESGKLTRLEVRLTKIFSRDNGKWRIAGGA